jgi:hypothetical protein
MSDTVQPGGPLLLPIREDFPSLAIPTVYADGVSSIEPGPHVMKFYLARLDPSMKAENKSLTQPFAQVVMQTNGFLQMTAFFNNIIRVMIDSNVITAAQFEEATRVAGGPKAHAGSATTME